MSITRKFLSLLESIDQGSGKTLATDNKRWDKRPAIVLMVVALCLLMLHYLKFNTTFYATLQIWFSQFSSNPANDLLQLRRETFFPLLSQAWWSFWHVITFICYPF